MSGEDMYSSTALTRSHNDFSCFHSSTLVPAAELSSRQQREAPYSSFILTSWVPSDAGSWVAPFLAVGAAQNVFIRSRPITTKCTFYIWTLLVDPLKGYGAG